MANFGDSVQEISPDLRIRKLGLMHLNLLTELLDENNCWKALAEVLTDPDDPQAPLLTAHDINTLELEWQRGRSPAGALIHHWSTSGVEQPKLKDLVYFLKEAELLRVAHYVEKEILQISDNCEESEDNLHNLTDIATEQLNSVSLDGDNGNVDDIDLGEMTRCDYNELSRLTKNFSEESIDNGGCKIGEGSYGCVYRVKLLGKLVAVKRLKSVADKQFLTEFKVLQKFKHENLLPLLGCSFNGKFCCLIYEYMENGSLQDRLSCKDNSKPIECELRMSIAYGSALGINHLHTFGESPLVHRDIKSANILLDKNFVPKVGDFGLVRMGDSATSETMAFTENICGTPVYMAWEAFNNEVSVKLDSFSFGVVLLELLTGLPPYDKSREDKDLISFMENYDDILDIIDPKILWDPAPAKELYSIAQSCLNTSKRKRPAISMILDDLKHCCRGSNS